jgi:aminopeptidase-like protein
MNTTVSLECGAAIHQMIADLYPICRSITGEGFRQSLKMLREWIPLTIHEVPSGTRVFDWTVPREWNIRDAWIRDSSGKKIVDFHKSNLHVMSYSIPVRERMSLQSLKSHLHTLPEHPDWIPYRTSYYKENWGFCLSHNQLLSLQNGEYEVCIDSTLSEGALTYGEYLIPGSSEKEILISTHACHPSLCNDNLSGVGVAAMLARELSQQKLPYSCRFLFIPGTIGAVTWLALNQPNTSRIRDGLVLACVGDPGKCTYKKSRRETARVDRAAAHVLKHSESDSEILDFSPNGYDERQFCSPGFDLPVGCFMRTPFARFPEYHTSADNLDFVRPEYLADSFNKCRTIIDILQHDRVYENLNPHCEPQLGKRGLYKSIGGGAEEDRSEVALLWVLNQSDGTNSLLDIAVRSGLPFTLIRNAAIKLQEHGLLKELPG